MSLVIVVLAALGVLITSPTLPPVHATTTVTAPTGVAGVDDVYPPLGS